MTVAVTAISLTKAIWLVVDMKPYARGFSFTVPAFQAGLQAPENAAVEGWQGAAGKYKANPGGQRTSIPAPGGD
jgi:hypothetical protein